jgi:hypothetical protein
MKTEYPRSTGNPMWWIVPCPRCGAPTGTPCVLPSGQYYQFTHKARMNAGDEIRMSTPDLPAFQEGNVYRMQIVIPGVYRRPRERVLTYLGKDAYGELVWNARPAAGTQRLNVDWIVSAEDLGKSHGRDDSRHMIGK